MRGYSDRGYSSGRVECRGWNMASVSLDEGMRHFGRRPMTFIVGAVVGAGIGFYFGHEIVPRYPETQLGLVKEQRDAALKDLADEKKKHIEEVTALNAEK